ncbi:hypothetical protein [Longispora fulva]|uniref:Uncharacterized protein n=1 Tax=Longispora fulva TaxID=619741 RepID=A0A8J7GHC2_9ACTN|nr:hypothetical protein [Longispora fulva]MBG6136268.1 hypothetical protein [Longispora fulva]
MRADSDPDACDQQIHMPQTMPLLPARVWSERDWTRIRAGYRAQDMDEKWNVHTSGVTAFMHRSWTGNRIYQATFAAVEGGWRISSALVESDPDHYKRTSDEFDRVMLEVVLSSIVLGEPATELRAEFVELTRRSSGRADIPGSVLQHSALGQRTEPTPGPRA